MVAMILSQFVSWFATAAWNFLDLFIIVISIGITTRFEQLTSALKDHLKNEIPTPKSMLKFRLDFIAICELLEYVDKHMGLIVFLSAANNLYFVCSQLLHAFKLAKLKLIFTIKLIEIFFSVLRYFADYLYYWFSLFYLISRTVYLFLSAAAISESARSPAHLLHNIPQHHWNLECDRWLFQINSSTIALSAMGFFNFTRGLILTKIILQGSWKFWNLGV
ncbi:gustatory receptor for sugar taste 64a-like isoform X2 [Episyrphus balteatus]|uniref:gustatory receptor for sugar taste 64a-like isoform X2 n=1 Tax=Episyrphus balteatus TaxID=286459 RepID=UPI00248564D9|nr:gustatory receptor for sugar taste 64a-like isoform X2 [Episyrphus balteatus]